MFRRSLASRDRAGKATKPKRTYRDRVKLKLQKLESPPLGSTLTSPIITITVILSRKVHTSMPTRRSSSHVMILYGGEMADAKLL